MNFRKPGCEFTSLICDLPQVNKRHISAGSWWVIITNFTTCTRTRTGSVFHYKSSRSESCFCPPPTVTSWNVCCAISALANQYPLGPVTKRKRHNVIHYTGGVVWLGHSLNATIRWSSCLLVILSTRIYPKQSPVHMTWIMSLKYPYGRFCTFQCAEIYVLYMYICILTDGGGGGCQPVGLCWSKKESLHWAAGWHCVSSVISCVC